MNEYKKLSYDLRDEIIDGELDSLDNFELQHRMYTFLADLTGLINESDQIYTYFY